MSAGMYIVQGLALAIITFGLVGLYLTHRTAIKRIDEAVKADATEASFKTAVIDAAMVAWVYEQTHETDPRKAINDIIGWHCMVANDPAVSEKARALIQQGRADAFDAVAGMVSSGENSDQWTWQRDMTLISVLQVIDPSRFRAWFHGAATMQAKPGRIEAVAASAASNRAHHIEPGGLSA